MIIYEMHCPVHKTIMKCDKPIQRKGATKKEPIFHCPSCKRYYMYDAGPDGKILGTYGDIEVMTTHETYKLYSDAFGGGGGTIWKDDKNKKDIWAGGNFPTPFGNAVDNTVRIKRIKDDEVSKAKSNLSNIRNEYPSIATEKMTVFDFALKVLGSNIDRDCVARNTSLMWKGNLVKKVEFYITDSPYLKNKIPTGTYVIFGGKLSNGELIIDEIRIIENPVVKEPFVSKKLKFAYDGPNHSNWFYEITKAEAKPATKLTGELAAWNDYLDWRKQLAELKIRGIKYIAFRVDYDERRMIFLTVYDSVDQAKEFKNFLKRNEVSIFSNYYSKNRWKFEFNREYQDNQDSGIDATFLELGEKYQGDGAVRYSIWGTIEGVSKQYKGEKQNLSMSDRISGISRAYGEPIYQEVAFELTERALGLIKRDIRRNGSISDNTEKSICEEFFGDGFLATTQIGDFALLSRLKRGIDDLASGKGAQQSLEQWLFDISKAANPDEIESITRWQNKKINDSQKRAVEKIISAPDVCLIQGPPGTGKTTVIAEAIYQCVIRNKRVLVASQANLAVDNALERLISNPKIRAIRLGNSKKIDDSVKNITEENVLETFYDSIVDYIQSVYLDRWEESDEVKAKAKKDLNDYYELQRENERLCESCSQLETKIDNLKNDANDEGYVIKQNSLRSEKMSVLMLRSLCDRNVDDIELMLGKHRLTTLWNAIKETIVQLGKGGLYLTKVGVEVGDLDSIVKLTQANRIIRHILLNAIMADNLKKRLDAESQFGGDSKEIENLKLLEKDLRNSMLSDPSRFSEWQDVQQRLKELEQQGLALSDSEENLFALDNIDDSEVRKNKVKAVLGETLNGIKNLFATVDTFVSESAEDIDEEIRNNEEEIESIYSEVQTKEDELKKLQSQKLQVSEKVNAILVKYDADSDTVQYRIKDYVDQRLEKLSTKLKRENWEGIFTGLRDWVSEIPDYSQEKDIFLRDFINGCNVVGVSCTENARTLTENGFDDFHVVIIDEVSKATPPELLIPMLRGRKVVLVGDHRQLPPLFNEHEKSYEEIARQQENNEDMIVPLTMEDFEKYKDMVTASLFQRYFENADESIKETLTMQYRMHSDIMDLINLFYDGYLQDGNEDNYTDDTKAHYLNIYSTFGTEMIVPQRHAYWFDSSRLAGERIYEYHRDGSPSIENLVEAETIIELLRKMEYQYANAGRKDPVSVGVISFYYNQVSLIKKMLKDEVFHAIDVEVNTVDRFQGKEKEIVFVSLVRNRKNHIHSVNAFIAAYQRINVAFSRAQNLLVIVGATDMYAEQPVSITDMNNGEEKIIYPYKQILEMMNTNGTYFTCDEVIPEIRVDEILTSISKQGEIE